MNARTQGFPGEHCIVTKWTVLITSPVSGFNVGADDINMTSPGVIFLDFTQYSSRATEDIIQQFSQSWLAALITRNWWNGPLWNQARKILKNLAETFFFSVREMDLLLLDLLILGNRTNPVSFPELRNHLSFPYVPLCDWMRTVKMRSVLMSGPATADL